MGALRAVGGQVLPVTHAPVQTGRHVLRGTASQWKLVALFLTAALIPLSGLAIYIRDSVREVQVRSAVSGLMNVATAEHASVSRFLTHNQELATQLAAQVEATGPESVQPLFASIVSGYHAVEFVRNGVIVVSSSPARRGQRWDRPVDLSHGHSDVYLVAGRPYLTFGAPARGGMVYVHADALVLSTIVNDTAGTGRTAEHYLVNRDNIMITASRRHPNALLSRPGSPLPWQRTLHGADDPACHRGAYTTNAGVAAGCGQALGFYPSAGGETVLGASVPFAGSEWTLVVEQSSAEVLSPLTTMRNQIWVILGLIVLGIGALAFGVARRITIKDTHSREAVHQASHDSLTGLPGRALFLNRLSEALGAAARGRDVSVLFIDLARFKAVNDTLGHGAGDELLAEVGDRIRDCVREQDIAARLGGDEFAVLLTGTIGPALAQRTADRIIKALRRPILIAGKEIFVAASIGVACGTAESQDASGLLGNADLAMYCAKKEGSRRPVVFAEHMLSGLTERLELPGELQNALGTDQIWVQYQPLLDLDTGNPLGVEALARWTHPTRGAIPPGMFIPMAEDTGAIVELGRWVLLESCRQVAQWRREGSPTLTLSVNVSARQLLDGQLAADVAAVLAETGLPAGALTLEMTESVLMDEPAKSLYWLRELKGLGVRLAVDDFGTGYSSLSYLRQFPVDELKIDKSFIDRIGSGAEDFAIVRTVIELARTLDLQTTAEGIETSAQLDSLRRLGCAVGQGYHFARPLDTEHMSGYLSSHHRGPAAVAK